VYKTFRPVSWRDEQTYYVPFTSLLREEHLVEDDLLRSLPGIYQALVPKRYELRITMMGRRAFGAKVLSQETESGKLDWRKSYAELRMERFAVPCEVEELCFDLLCRLGLVFGCFDFVVTPEGELVFLEVNEMGQFLFIEHYTGCPLLDAFSEFLLQRRVDFAWDERRVRIRYPEVEPEAEALARRSLDEHVPPPNHSLWEGRSTVVGRRRPSSAPRRSARPR
jgi:hypothetical protein